MYYIYILSLSPELFQNKFLKEIKEQSTIKKKANITILMSDKIKLKVKSIKHNKKGHCILIWKYKLPRNDVINLFVLNNLTLENKKLTNKSIGEYRQIPIVVKDFQQS